MKVVTPSPLSSNPERKIVHKIAQLLSHQEQLGIII